MTRLVLLDLYGTLLEADWPKLLAGRAAIAERAGLSATEARAAWDRTHIARMTGSYGSLTEDLAAVISEASNGQRSASISAMLLTQLARMEWENWQHGVNVYNDALPSLRALRSNGLRLAIVTNASAEAAQSARALPLRSLVDGVIASCEVGVLKPELVAVALRRFGVDASDAVLVDDEPGELDRALALGLRTILIQRPGAEGLALTTVSAHAVASDLLQAARLIVHGEPAQSR